MSKEGGGERRRSARISALEEAAACKSNTHEKPHHHQLPQQQQQQQQGRRQRDATSITKPPPPLTMHGSGSRQRLPDRKRGRKKKRLQDVVVTSVSKDEGNQKYEDIPINSDQLAILPSLQRFPEKRILEFILDVLQRRDTHEIFAEPVDAEEVEGYYEIVKEPMDFGTMRAKLQEGMYTTLEQFEHDVFLISSNAMLFNSSTTIYFRQARAIQELAKRVFHALKTDPENFELEFSLARKRGGRKPQGEAGGPHTKLATFLKPAGVKIGVSPSGRPGSSNGPSLSRNFQACLASSNLNFHIDGRESEILLGSGSGRSSNLFETERRQTYRPWTFFPCENDSIVSAVHNCPKSLMHVNHGDIGYKESLMKFVKDLGPTAQMVARRKLGLIEASNCQSLTPAPSIKAPNCVISAPPGPWGPAHVDGFMNDQMPQNLLRNLLGNSNVITDANERLNIRDDAFGGGKVQSDSMDIHGGAYRGKMACADHRRDIQLCFPRRCGSHQ
ncbi:hypothetical protein L1049_013801 [Liquidambar formosana]|uniref:Bromo domain-containing protein n=1 Tax=Liquidambar formosana TaxID=63359 RepID=A0AAP0RPI4_LIQFO